MAKFPLQFKILLLKSNRQQELLIVVQTGQMNKIADSHFPIPCTDIWENYSCCNAQVLSAVALFRNSNVCQECTAAWIKLRLNSFMHNRAEVADVLICKLYAKYLSNNIWLLILAVICHWSLFEYDGVFKLIPVMWLTCH